MKLQSGHEVVPLEGTELKKQQDDWEGYSQGLVRLTPGRWLFPTNYKKVADRIYNSKLKKSDVFIMTYPKCGTTWTQETIWTMRNNPDLNSPKAGRELMLRSPFIEFDMFMPPPSADSPPPPSDNPAVQVFREICPGKNPADGIHVQLAECIPEPRTIKTHLPFSLMPPSLLDTTKVVYVARNPKDVIISYHHHCRLIPVHGYVGNFEDYVEYFVNDDLVYGPYWLHVKEAWEKKNHPNLHIIFFEDMKTNTMEELRKLDTFLNTNLTEKQLENIAKYTSFSEMKTRAETAGFNERFKSNVLKEGGGFFRKGKTGDWKGKFTPALEAKVDQWIKKNMTSFGIDFKYGN